MVLEANLAVAAQHRSWATFEGQVDTSYLGGSPGALLLAWDIWQKMGGEKLAEEPGVKPPSDTPSMPPPAAVPSKKAVAKAVAEPVPPSPMEISAETIEEAAEPPRDEAPGAISASLEAKLAEQKQQARNEYMRFYRSVRSNKLPAAVAVKFREASNDVTGLKMKALFAEYIECSANWLTSTIVLTQTQSDTSTDGNRWGWLTREACGFHAC